MKEKLLSFIRRLLGKPAPASVAVSPSGHAPDPPPENHFKSTFGFEYCARQSPLFRKQEEIAFAIVKAIARMWQIACWEEEEIDRELKDALPVYLDVVPGICLKALAAKEKVVEVRARFDRALALVVERGFINGNAKAFPTDGSGGLSSSHPMRYLGSEEEKQALRKKYEAQKAIA